MGLAYLILLVSILPAIVVCVRVKYNTAMRDAQRLKDIVSIAKEDTQEHFGKVRAVMDGIRGLFLASREVKPEDWNIFLDSLGFARDRLGMQDLGFVVRVKANEVADHTDKMKKIRQAYKIFPFTPREEYYPIVYLCDGDAGDVTALGWDAISQVDRREAMQRAMDTGHSACTKRLTMTLPKDDREVEGYVVYLPVYHGAVKPDTVEERRDKLAGFVFASFTQEALWTAMLRGETTKMLDVEIFEGDKLVYDSHPQIPPGARRKGLAISGEGPLKMSGQQWRARVTTLEAFDKGSLQYVVWCVALVCALISFTLFWLARKLALRQILAEEITNNLRKSEKALSESEARFRRLADNARDVIYRFRLKGQIGYDYISPAIERMSGHPASRFYGDVKFLRDFVHPDDRHLLTFDPPDRWFGEPIIIRWLRTDGSVLWTESRNVPVYDEDGHIVAMEGIARDISESKFIEEAIRRSEERLTRIVETIADAVVILDGAGEITFRNAAAEEILDLSKTTESDLRPLVERLRVRGRRSFYYTYRRAGREELILSINTAPFSTKGGAMAGVVASIRDVTLEKENETSLVESQTRLRILNNILGLMAAGSEVTQIVVRTVSELSRFFPDYRIVFSQANDQGGWTAVCSEGAMASVKGASFNFENEPELREEFFGAKPLVIADIQKDERFARLRRLRYLEGSRGIIEQPLRRGANLAGMLSFHSPEAHHWTAAEKVMLQEIADYIAAAFAQFDVAERRKQAEAALEAEKERLAVTLRSIADGVITTDVQGRVALMNRAAETLTGWTQSDALGRLITEIFVVVDEKTREKLPNPAVLVIENQNFSAAGFGAILLARDGKERFINESAAAIHDQKSNLVGAALVFRDVTEKRRFERELQKASKLESVGVLAGGIAHDFNNILSVILGNVTLSKMMSPPGSPLHERLAQAEKGSLRARELTQQLLTFAKGGAPIRKSASIIEIINESVAFAARGSNVVSRTEAAPDLWPVEVDEGQISQVFNNLVINAVQAMPEGGTLRTQMENCHVFPGNTLPLTPGRYVHISAQDTGVGISREHLPRIFDPYFSTKQGGSGLGLATTYAIIKKHQGCITVESAVGKGTTFHIYLPASEMPAPRKRSSAELIPQGCGRVLVMDDEAAILDLARESLLRFGYDVDTAVHGGEAVEKYQVARQAGNPYAAVIMDLTVPGGMGGREAMKRLLEIDPKVKAIVSSGYSHDPVMANYKQFGFSGVVEKPYQVEVLAKALAHILVEAK